MFIEVKNQENHGGCAYIMRSVHDGALVKDIIIENLGSVESLQKNHPNIVESLKSLCNEGSIELFKSRILNQDIKLRLALNKMAANSQFTLSDREHSDELDTAKQQYDLLDKARTTLNYDEQLLVINSYAKELQLYQTAIENIQLHKSHSLSKDSNVSYALPPYECFIESGLIDAVVVAAGVGSRMGANIPKQYLTLGDKTVLEQTVMKLLCCPYISRVIVVISEQDPYFKYTCLGDLQGVTTVFGGKERVDSVLNGLQAVNTKYCLVHDAARPLFLMHDLEKLILQVAQGLSLGFCGGILACKVADTLKQSFTSDKKSSVHAIEKTVDRSYMYRAQTPQLFKTQQLIEAINHGLKNHQTITDEASALELLSEQVLLVEGSALNFKLTDKSDMLMANAIWNFNN